MARVQWREPVLFHEKRSVFLQSSIVCSIRHELQITVSITVGCSIVFVLFVFVCFFSTLKVAKKIEYVRSELRTIKFYKFNTRKGQGTYTTHSRWPIIMGSYFPKIISKFYLCKPSRFTKTNCYGGRILITLSSSFSSTTAQYVFKRTQQVTPIEKLHKELEQYLEKNITTSLEGSSRYQFTVFLFLFLTNESNRSFTFYGELDMYQRQNSHTKN